MNEPNSIQSPRTLSDILRERVRFIVQPTVVLLGRLGMTPNMLTLFGLLVHIPIAWALATGRWRMAALLGLLSMFDILDGALARHLKHTGSTFGAFFDSSSDRLAEVILFGGLIYYFSAGNEPMWAIVSYAALAGSLMVSYTRGRGESLGIDCKIGLFSRLERYLTLFVFGMLELPIVCMIVLAIGTWVTVVQRVVYISREALAADRAK